MTNDFVQSRIIYISHLQNSSCEDTYEPWLKGIVGKEISLVSSGILLERLGNTTVSPIGLVFNKVEIRRRQLSEVSLECRHYASLLG
jgi:hypothetical protein